MSNQSFKTKYVVCSTREKGLYMNMVRDYMSISAEPSPFVNFKPLIYSGQAGQ